MSKINISDNCMACGQCLEVCHHGAITLNATFGYSQCYIDQIKCVRCKKCIEIDCPADAIKEVE